MSDYLTSIDENTPVLKIISDGPGRTYAVEVLDAIPEGYDENLHIWQAVESGDLDGWYENAAENVAMGEEEVPEDESEEDFVKRVHPPCEVCGNPIFVNCGDWFSPDGDYYCSNCVTIVD